MVVPRVPVLPAVPKTQQLRAYLRLARRRPRRDQLRVVVFAQGRTGSTLLVDLLGAAPGVHADGEILARPVLWPRGWVEAARRHRVANTAYCFKVKIYQLTDAQRVADPGRWLGGMANAGWQVIYLHRRNLLRHVLSNMVAERRGTFEIRGRDVPVVDRLTVDPNELIRWMRIRRATGEAERAALAQIAHTSVCYEDDLLDGARHQMTYDRLAVDLGLPAGEVRTDVRRTTPDRLEDIVENYDELAAALRGTEWERHLGDAQTAVED